MSNQLRSRLFRMGALASLLASALVAQVSSSVVGTVADPGHAVMPGIPVQLTDQGTGATRTAVTDGSGVFRFTNITAGTYTVNVTATGFKTHVEKDVVVAASETRDVGTLALEVGSVREQVTITAEATPVQTGSSEKGATIDANQMNDVALRGRDVMGFLKLVPGVLDTNGARDTGGYGALTGLTITGNTSLKNFTVDGISILDDGNGNGAEGPPNLDAVQEIRVLSSNYQAEYGRNSGGTVMIVTKGGTKVFHGSGWWTHRHEEFNANNFFNNRSGLARTPYRYNIDGWSFGGPVFIPKHFNADKRRLFFLVSQEYTGQKKPTTTNSLQVPTALERTGDFSKSLNTNGTLLVIKDPTTGAAFPGNKIASASLNSTGALMLGILPLPNYFPAAGSTDYLRYNFQTVAGASEPLRNDTARLDVYLTDRLSANVRVINQTDDQIAPFQVSTFGLGANGHKQPGWNYGGTLTYTISNTTVNELTIGAAGSTWDYWYINPKEVDRSLFGPNLPKLFPFHALDDPAPPAKSSGEYNFLPSLAFGSLPVNTAALTSAGGRANSINPVSTWEIHDNLSRIKGSHSLKFGVYIGHSYKGQPQSSAYLGNYSFATDSTNPLDSGNGYANALLGNFTSYTEANNRFFMTVHYMNWEWFAQDSWKALKKLTLDIGVRFTHQTPQTDSAGTFAYFDPSLYSAANAPRQYAPGLDANKKRIAVDPLTGATAPVAAIGLFVAGTGNTANGMVATHNTPTYSNRWLNAAPRFGFAYDVFGNGKMAIRGGYGIYFNRLDGNQYYGMAGLPPVGYTATVAAANITSLSGASGLIGPSVLTIASGRENMDYVQNASIGVQTAIGFGTVLDVAYAGNFARNLPYRVNLNPIALGTDFNPLYADPTQPGKPLATALLPVPYKGWGAINKDVMEGFTNYNALHVTATRRKQKGLEVAAAAAYSKSMGVTAFDPLVADNVARNYGPQAASRKLILTVNYIYDIPGIGKKVGSKALGALTDRWTLSGITAFTTGGWYTPTFTTSPSLDITGSSSETPRINVVGDPNANIPAGYLFNPAAFAEPAVGTIGNAGVNVIQLPHYWNFDVTLSKAIPVGLGENRLLKLQIQTFNLFNHTEFTAVNSAATYNASGVQTTAAFGTPSAALNGRILSLAMRFQF